MKTFDLFKANKYYNKLLLHADKLGLIVNPSGQQVIFYEHPTLGDEHPVIVAFPEYEVAFDSDFFDLDDMSADHGEYVPYFIDGGMIYGYELSEYFNKLSK